jgi:hypothetical protein
MVMEIDALRVIQALDLLIGGVIVYFALKSYAKHRNKSMLLLAVGFAFVTIGAILAGVVFEVVSGDLAAADIVQASCQVVGFGIIVYSIIGGRG